MAKKKSVGKKKVKKNSPKQKKKELNIVVNLLKGFAGVLFLVFLVVSAGFLAHHFLPISKIQKLKTVEEQALRKQTKKKTIQPKFEIFPKDDKIPAIKVPKSLPPSGMPRVAIIIDDLGYNSKIAKKFSDLGVEVTFSILPFSPQKTKIANMAKKKGLEVMLHLPLEPFEYPGVNPGPGVLLASMVPDVFINQLIKDLDSVPYVRGVNNHMGSRITTISTKMYQIFSILKKRDLFFIDSRTTKDSLCKPSARLLRIPFAERDVFLDHTIDSNFIREQIRRLLRIAERQGEAIGIAHPHKTTYRVLRDELSDIKARVRLVKASSIVQIIGE